MGVLPPATAHCLSRAFRQIENGTLKLRPDPLTPGLFTTAACNHVIVVSIERGKAKGGVLDIIYYTPTY